MDDNVLRIENLSKKYYTKDREILVINNISFDVLDNTITSVVGPSGCGKSTLLNIIGGLDKASGGYIYFNGNKKKIGYMFQNDALFPWLNILDNCLMGLKIENNINKENVDYVIGLLNNYGLGDFIYSYPDNLSGGMRQRVG